MRQLRVTYEGQPLEVLTELIRKRSQVMHQCMDNAVAGTMVNVLRSLRSDTKNAIKTKKFNVEVEDTGFYGGFSYSEKKRCVRAGVSKYSSKVKLDGKVVWLTWDKPKQSECHVYKVTNEQNQVYYVGARNTSMVMNYELGRIKKRISNYGGLAKNVLSIAMNQIATKSLPQDGSNVSRNKASTLSKVTISQSGNMYTITVVDEVNYGTDALKSGEAGVNLAIMKAANKTAGMLNRIAGRDFKEHIETPFPEVKTRR